MRIEQATPEDCRAIAEVHVLSWQHAYKDILPAEYLDALSITSREAMWRESFFSGQPQLLVAKDNGTVVGFVAFGPSRDEGAQPLCAEVWAIYLTPSIWSQGAGRLLWLTAWERLLAQGFKIVSLWVIVGNERAIRFYSAAGFKPATHSTKAFTLGGVSLQEIRYDFNGNG
ncbi:GNAT family N-acetyltransferase [Polaromonas sp. SM01]|uniref:GNAT family N-acetyltransferase n=1 Tax=Polaromonas sp. SM01 TaxID=3085630 RepID=UPI0029822EAE|nr:GNAT family N-acetyltransferase [Polaromonas sp. SM01]MDW5441484.1 GNAT family N-acetyltransferase [Polaromonas sp. SM01]